MSSLEIILIAVGLAMDALAVAIGIGLGGQAQGPRSTFRLSFHFGLFQFMMPILGWLAGSNIASLIRDIGHGVASILLAYVGGNMMRPSSSCEETTEVADPTRGKSLVMLSVATSIGAFAIGLGLGMLGINIVYPSMIIGIVAAGFTLVGLRLGCRLGDLCWTKSPSEVWWLL